MISGKKCYLSGCGGMLGEAFYEALVTQNQVEASDKNPSEPWLRPLDFRNSQAYEAAVQRFQPDFLFHLGALTDLEYCETHIQEAEETNAKAVKTAVQLANQIGCKLIYISTAGIFDGKKESYTEEDAPAPLSVYARTKYEGEMLVTKTAKDFLVLRPGWMMGGGPAKDKKFVKKIISQILSGSKKISIVDDKMGTPTYTVDFANNSLALLAKEKSGLYHMVCEGQTSRWEVAGEILALQGLDPSAYMQKVPSEYFAKEYFAHRPRSEILINQRLKQEGLLMMRDWKESLREYLWLRF